MAYFQKYRIRYYDIRFGVLWDARLMFDEWHSGDVTDFTYSVNPIQYNAPSGEVSRITPIKGSSVIVGFYNMTFEQYTNDFLTVSRKKIRLDLYKDGSIWWKGYYIPDTLREPYLSGPNLVQLEFNDGLGALKDVLYRNDKEVYYGRKKLLTVIWECLQGTGLDLDLEESTYFYESHMNQEDTDSPLEQVYCTSEGFIERDDEITCGEILTSILIDFVARIYQRNGIWWITPIKNLKHAYTSRSYLSNPVTKRYNYDTTRARDISVIISGGSVALEDLNAFTNRSQIREVDRAVKLVEVTQDYGPDDNIIWNGDFGYWAKDRICPVGFKEGSQRTFTKPFTQEGRKGIYWPTDFIAQNNDWIQLSSAYFPVESQVLKIEYYYNFFLTFSISYNCPWGVSAEIRIKWILEINDSGTKYYLKLDGTWTTHGHFNTSIISVSDKPISGSISVNTDGIPANGDVRIVIYAPTSTVDEQRFYIDEISLSFGTSFFSTIEEKGSVSYSINENNLEILEVELYLGDLPVGGNRELIYRSGLYYLIGGVYYPTFSWVRKGVTDPYALINLVAEEIALLHNKNRWKLSGNMIGNIDIGARYIASDGRIYMIDEIANYDLKTSRADLVLLEIDQSAEAADGWMEWTDSSGYVEWTDSSGYVEPT